MKIINNYNVGCITFTYNGCQNKKNYQYAVPEAFNTLFSSTVDSFRIVKL